MLANLLLEGPHLPIRCNYWDFPNAGMDFVKKLA